MGHQEEYFASIGGDEYFERNRARQDIGRKIPGLSKRIQEWALTRSSPGSLCVFGGASGSEASFLSSVLPGWTVTNIDISAAAIEHGRVVFPSVNHVVASLTERDLERKIGVFDSVLLVGILCWIDRSALSRAILNVDECLKPGGVLGIHDFFPPCPKKNPMSHAENVYTYKQDYAKMFEAIGVFRVVEKSFSAYDTDLWPLEDRLVGYSVLEKLSTS